MQHAPRSESILVVEDESIVALDLAHTLRGRGYQVRVASSAEEALEKSAALRPDLVLMDVRLKNEMDGIEAGRRLRSRFNVPVVYLTAFADERTLERAQLAGAFGYLLKPYDEAELNTTIAMALSHHRMEAKLRASEQWLTRVLTNIDDAVIACDAQRRVSFLNGRAEALTGWTSAEASGRPLDDVFRRTADDLLLARDGRSTTVESSSSPLLDDDGVNLGTVIVFRDTSERRRAEAALRASEERYALAAQGANDGLWDWDVLRETVYYSPRWKSMLGHSEADIGGTSREWLDRIHPEDRARVRAEIRAHLDGKTAFFRSEHRMRTESGGWIWVLTRGIAVRDGNGAAVRMAGSQTDISDRKAAEERLKHDALHDSLTGLPNRALFMDRLERACERGRRRPDYLFAVLFLDIDRFKLVNDSLGHAAGDGLLIGVARRLADALRTTDTVARFGGDEFVLLLDDLEDAADAQGIVERLQETMQAAFKLGSHELMLSASIGVVLSTRSYHAPEDLLRDADTAMYRAKAAGKARYEVFDAGMHAEAVSLQELERDLHRAVSKKELRLVYQPIVNLVTGELAGFEALCRWRHPERGEVPPGQFIPVAEENGLIVPIGAWVLAEAMRQRRAWDGQLPVDFKIAVNLSSKQLARSDFVATMEALLEEQHYDARGLALEITESVIVDNQESVAESLARLRAMGMQIHIDDFGTGYSSLSYLHRFPVDMLKIDGTFVRALGQGRVESQIVWTIVTLARSLRLRVVAEGVETREQHDLLRQLECHYAQGYLFSRPLEAQQAGELLSGPRKLAM